MRTSSTQLLSSEDSRSGCSLLTLYQLSPFGTSPEIPSYYTIVSPRRSRRLVSLAWLVGEGRGTHYTSSLFCIQTGSECDLFGAHKTSSSGTKNTCTWLTNQRPELAVIFNSSVAFSIRELSCISQILVFNGFNAKRRSF